MGGIDWSETALKTVLAKIKAENDAEHAAMMERAETNARRHREQYRLTALWTQFDLWFSTRVLAAIDRGWGSLWGR